MAMKTIIGIFLLACCGRQNVQGQTSVDFDVDTGIGKDPSVSVGINHESKKGWIAGGKGTFDTKGNWLASGEVGRKLDGWNAGLHGALDSNDNWKAGLGLGKEGKNWSSGIKGSTDSRGNWVASAEASRKFDGWNVGVSGALDSNDNWKAGLGLSKEGKKWSAGIKGTTDSIGNFGVGAGFSLRFRKRSVDWNGEHFTVTLHADPCEFSLYDINRDGVIVKNELHAIFGDRVKAEELFSALDITTGDGHIDEEEFYFMSHIYIHGCESANKERQTKYM